MNGQNRWFNKLRMILMNRLRYSIPGEIHEEYEDAVHDAFKKIAEKYTWEMAMDEQNLGLILRTAFIYSES